MLKLKKKAHNKIEDKKKKRLHKYTIHFFAAISQKSKLFQR